MVANVFCLLFFFFFFQKIQNNKDNKEIKQIPNGKKGEKKKKEKTVWSAFVLQKKKKKVFTNKSLTVSFLVFNHQSEPDSPLLHIRQEGGKKRRQTMEYTRQRSQKQKKIQTNFKTIKII